MFSSEKEHWLLRFIKRLPHIERVYLVSTIVLVFAICILIINHIVSWSILADGQIIALTKKRSEAKKAIELLLEEEEEKHGYPVSPIQEISIKPAWQSFSLNEYHLFDKCSLDNLVEHLKKELSFGSNSVAIIVNGNEVVCVPSMDIARGSLGLLKEQFRPPGASDVEFEETVELVEKFIAVDELVDRDKALEILIAGVDDTNFYQVIAGDTLWDIARDAGISLEKLMTINQGIEPKSLMIGQQIKLPTRKPILNIVSRYEVVEIEDIPFSVVEQEDPSLEYGERQVIQQGIPGKVEITYKVVEKNGEVVDKYPMQRVVKQAPRTQVVDIGSRMMLVSRSGGAVYWPAKGSVSSSFGMREGRMHYGIDIAANHGSPVVATNAGTVKYAGYRGGYGLLVEIEHSNEMLTRYAHLSDIFVFPGQRVAGGELIAHIGATGNATGPHLHFEVWSKGDVINPEDYFKNRRHSVKLL